MCNPQLVGYELATNNFVYEANNDFGSCRVQMLLANDLSDILSRVLQLSLNTGSMHRSINKSIT
jgi:hypothetical protein